MQHDDDLLSRITVANNVYILIDVFLFVKVKIIVHDDGYDIRKKEGVLS